VIFLKEGSKSRTTFGSATNQGGILVANDEATSGATDGGRSEAVDRFVEEIVCCGSEVCRSVAEALLAFMEPNAARAVAMKALRLERPPPLNMYELASRIDDEIRRAGGKIGKAELQRRLRVPAARIDQALAVSLHYGWLKATREKSAGGRPRIVIEPDSPLP
jgi:hypothetical protein